MVITSELFPRYKITDWEIGSFQIGNVDTHDGTSHVSSIASDNNSGSCMFVYHFLHMCSIQLLLNYNYSWKYSFTVTLKTVETQDTVIKTKINCLKCSPTIMKNNLLPISSLNYSWLLTFTCACLRKTKSTTGYFLCQESPAKAFFTLFKGYWMFTHHFSNFRLLIFSDLSCNLLTWRQIEQPSLKPDKVRCPNCSQYGKVRKWEKDSLEIPSSNCDLSRPWHCVLTFV